MLNERLVNTAPSFNKQTMLSLACELVKQTAIKQAFDCIESLGYCAASDWFDSNKAVMLPVKRAAMQSVLNDVRGIGLDNAKRCYIADGLL